MSEQKCGDWNHRQLGGRGPHLSSDYQMISIPHFRNSVIVQVMLLAWLPPKEPFHAEQKAKNVWSQ